MKVGTDGVLLGAWSRHSGEQLLDIGTGTGLLALMMAQRFKGIAIDAIEIDELATIEAQSNVDASPWSDRITVLNTSIQNYKPNKKYNSIICNPPFFVNSTKAHNSERNTARHTQDLPFEDLVLFAASHLIIEGIFSLVLPPTEGEHFEGIALEKGLHLNRKTVVYPSPGKPVKRWLMEFCFQQNKSLDDDLIIESGARHEYSKEYITLTKEFYLNM